MLTAVIIILSILAYLIPGLFVSRNYWFKTRNAKLGHYYWGGILFKCRENWWENHRKVCNKNAILNRKLKTALLIVFWPILSVAKLVSSFYLAPVKKLEKDKTILKAELETLKEMALAFDAGTNERKIMIEQHNAKQKELEAMR